MNLIQGHGLGLRPEHYLDFRRQPAPTWGLGWLEILSENYMVPGGKPLEHLDAIRRDVPVVMHGVSLSIGGADPLDLDYLRDLKALADRVEPAWVSDHLCWTGVGGVQLHDLLPLPYTRATVRHVAERVGRVQELLGRRLVLENVSSYVAWAQDEMSEADFIVELLSVADCELLLDVNNVHVSAHNHGFDARAFIKQIPAERVRQIHLAGHRIDGDWLIDTHDQPVSEAVWSLYRYTLEQFGPVPTMIERDDHIPPLAELIEELARVRQISDDVQTRRREAQPA
jgi:uncharacterized protein (UPF0276 family)